MFFFFACSSSEVASDAMGVSPGGSEDIGLAREIIEAGGVPPAESFTAEGLFSEHDLPLSGDCAQLLCAAAPAALTEPVDGRGARLLLQLGFTTGLESFERRPLRLALAVDVSGSMGERMDGATKLETLQEALHLLADQLDAADQVALVSFDDVAQTLLELQPMNEGGLAALRAAVDGLAPGDSTNIEAGLARAYAQVEGQAAPGLEARVMLLTDAQPNTGATGTSSFLGLVQDGANDDVGITVMGVGLDFGSELADAIAKVRGGNSFYLDSRETAVEIFGEQLAYVVTPVAYDLEVRVSPAAGLALDEAYGVPVDQAQAAVSIGATTLFFSEGGGGMGILLEGAIPESGPTADFALAYEDAETGEAVAESLQAGWEGGSGDFLGPADDLGVYKMAVLVDEYQALLAGAAWCRDELDGAAAQVAAAQDRLADRAAELDDDPLGEEAALMGRLAENIAGGRQNCVGADAAGY